MEEEGEDQEDKWTREKLDQIQPTNPDIHSLFLHWTRTVPTKTRSTDCKSTNTEYKEKYYSCNSCGALLHCSGESWEEESL